MTCFNVHRKMVDKPSPHRRLVGNNRPIRRRHIPTNSVCAHARGKYNQSEGDSLIDVNKVISDSFQVIVDGTQSSGNYYQP
jgi:hypothetical protein